MSEPIIYVFVDLDNKPYLAGELSIDETPGRKRSTFTYSESWLKSPQSFAIEPALALHSGKFITPLGHLYFGAFSDVAPDRGERPLIPDAHTELEFLLGVNDVTRKGALRFALQPEGPFLASSKFNDIPTINELPNFLAKTDKITVREKNNILTVAKFANTVDKHSKILWETVALHIATKAQIHVPRWRIEKVQNASVLLVERFDRIALKRIPYLSMLSLLSARDDQQHSYLEMVNALQAYGADPHRDIIELWSRLVFNILISNTDDHLRNHGLLYVPNKGWKLAPIFDTNPTPIDIKPRILTTMINLKDKTASLDLALSVATKFDLTLTEAKLIARQIGISVQQWKNIARNLGINETEIDNMSTAFEHKDLKLALTL